MDYKGIPVIHPSAKFDIEKDTAALRAAMKGFGTDEEALINILLALSNEQRQKLKENFNTTLKRDLIVDLKSETSGKFKEVLKALMMPPIDYLCKRMHDAMKYASFNKSENVLIEALFTRANEDMPKIVSSYQNMYNKSITEDIRTLTTVSDLRPLLAMLLKGKREPAGTLDDAKAKKQAQELLAVGKGALNPKEEVFHRMLVESSLAQLRCVFKYYNELAGHSVHDAIKRGMETHPEIMLSIGESEDVLNYNV